MLIRPNLNLTEDRRLEPDEFRELLESNEPNKYDRLTKEIDTGTSLSFVFRRIKYQQMLRSGAIRKDGLSHIERNKKKAFHPIEKDNSSSFLFLQRAKS